MHKTSVEYKKKENKYVISTICPYMHNRVQVSIYSLNH